MKFRVSIVVIFLVIFSFAAADKKRIAILPLDNLSDSKYDWIATGIAESIQVKFSQDKKLLLIERSLIDKIVLANQGRLSKNQNIHTLLGTDYILLGSYVVFKDKIRVNVRIIQSENSVVLKEHVFSQTSDLKHLFELQNEIASEVSKKCNLETGLVDLKYNIGQNLQAYQNYVLARIELKKGKFEKAIELFLKAQQLNGTYFSEAHGYEGRARIALAKQEKSDERSRAIQKEHISKFVKDANEAANAFFDLGNAFFDLGNAFFDLGNAYYASEQYENAVKQYREYIRWYDQTYQPYRWGRRAFIGYSLITETCKNFYAHGKRERDQNVIRDGGTGVYALQRQWLTHSGNIYTISDIKGTLTSSKVENGEQNWQSTLTIPKTTEEKYFNLLIRDQRLFSVSCDYVEVISLNNGEKLLKFPLSHGDKHELRSYILEEINCLVIFSESNIAAYSLQDGKLLWKDNTSVDRVTDYAICISKNQFYVANKYSKALYKLNPNNGQKILLRKFKKLVAQVWPGQNHVLIRTTNSPLLGGEDKFYKYYPKQDLFEPCKENIFFSYIYNRNVSKEKDYVIPVMDIEKHSYDFVKAKYILPYTVTKRMDKGTGLYRGQHTLPWLVKSGEKFWMWNKNFMIQCYRVSDGKLVWRKYIPRSWSGIGIDGKYLIVRDGEAHFKVYWSLSPRSSQRSIEAFINMGRCYEKLKKYNESFDQFKTALLQDATDARANYYMARFQRRIGGTKECLEYYDRVYRFSSSGEMMHKEAKDYLANQVGFIKSYDLENCKRMALQRKGLIIENDLGENSILSVLKLPNKSWQTKFLENPGEWTVIDGTVYGLRPGIKYPIRTKGHRKIIDKLSPSMIDKIQSKNDKVSVVYKKNLGDEEEDVLYEFDDLDNRYARPSIPNIGSYTKSYLLRGQIFIYGNNQHEIVAVNLKTKKTLWKVPFKGYVNIQADQRKLIIAEIKLDVKTQRTKVWCHDLLTGELKWEQMLDCYQHFDKQIMPRTKLSYHPLVPQAYVVMNPKRIFIIYQLFKNVYDNPHAVVHTLHPDNGKVLKSDQTNFCIDWAHQMHGTTNLRGELWTYATREIKRVEMVIDQNTLGFGKLEDHLYVDDADFNERHPAVLAQFPPLKECATDFTLEKHKQVLNHILDTPKLRKELINQYREKIVNFNSGHESVTSAMKYYLKKKSLTDLEEKFTARGIFSFWNNQLRYNEIRRPYFPITPRGSFLGPVVDGKMDNEWLLGTYRKGSVQLYHKKQNFKLLTKWREIAKLGWGTFGFEDYTSVHQIGDYFAYRLDDGQVYLFEWEKFQNYLLNSVQESKAYYYIGENKISLSKLYDGDTSTTVKIKAQRECFSIGIDVGPKNKFKNVYIKFSNPENNLEDVLVESSNHSRNAYLYVHFIEDEKNDGAGGHNLKFRKENPSRYYRLTFPAGKAYEIAEIKFF